MTQANTPGIASYKDPSSCRCSDIPNPTNSSTTAPDSAPDCYESPRGAFLSFNHCNLPSRLLGAASYQRHPLPLRLDGVHELHRRLFDALDALDDAQARARLFAAHMEAHFSLHQPQEAGAERPSAHVRPRAHYLRLLRGWGFSSEGREGAVLKGWVESRFGLMTRYHKEPLGDAESDAYARFLAERSSGLYGAHALEAQLDLVYSYVQYELARRHPGLDHLTLYRGVNQGGAQELALKSPAREGRRLLLLNNLNSFTQQPERADEFGDRVLAVRVPLYKVFCMYGLLPGLLHGEDEVMVVGGVYAAEFMNMSSPT